MSHSSSQPKEITAFRLLDDDLELYFGYPNEIDNDCWYQLEDLLPKYSEEFKYFIDNLDEDSYAMLFPHLPYEVPLIEDGKVTGFKFYPHEVPQVDERKAVGVTLYGVSSHCVCEDEEIDVVN